MDNKILSYLLIIVLLVVLTGCDLASNPMVESIQLSQTLTPAIEAATATNTAIPPTQTPVPPTDTPTETSTPTVTPTSTPTEEPASLVVEQDAVCRSGPGTDYSIVGYQSAGDTPELIGRSENDPIWWVIQYEGKDDPCWIDKEIVSVDGNVANLPLATPPPTATVAPPSNLEGDGIYYFLVSENTGGPFGCGDSLLYISTGIPRSGSLEVDIRNALTALFANEYEYYNGLYNPIYASSLRVEDVDADPNNTDTVVYLRGDFVKPKDKCDAMRMRAQVWETIETQFPEVERAVIFLHHALFGDKLASGW